MQEDKKWTNEQHEWYGFNEKNPNLELSKFKPNIISNRK